jgi:hypothetical protein
LRVSYGSGVTIKELASLSQIIALVLGLPRPSRETRRRFRLLIGWYESNWSVIEPILPTVHLLDEHGLVIDGSRELTDLAQHL